MSISRDQLAVYKRSRQDPVFWIKNVVGDQPYDKQEEVAYSVRDNQFTSVAAANGAGKTFVASRIGAWWLTTFEDSILVTTAPTGRQVRELLWGEIHRLYGRSKYPLGGELLQTKWEIAPGWYGIGFSTDDPNMFQGFHPPSGRILVIADEAAGIEDPIFEAIDSVITSEYARLLLIGNPTETSGRFYDSFHGPARHLYRQISISAFDTPNLKAGKVLYPWLVTPQWVEDRRVIWGEDSAAFISRVLAQFPLTGTKSFIPAAWVDRSFEVDKVQINEALKLASVHVIGVDVARFGDDSSVITVRRGDLVTRIEKCHHVDTYLLWKEVQRIADEESIGTPSSRTESFLVVDADGVGAGVLDNAIHAGYRALAFHGGQRANLPERYINRRTEAYWSLRERFRTKHILIPRRSGDGSTGFFGSEYIDLLRGQLTGIQYDFDALQRYRLETKEEMKKRLSGRNKEGTGKSPDEADSLVYAFAFDSPAETIVIRDGTTPEERKTEEAKDKPGTVAYLMAQAEKESRLEEELAWLK